MCVCLVCLYLFIVLFAFDHPHDKVKRQAKTSIQTTKECLVILSLSLSPSLLTLTHRTASSHVLIELSEIFMIVAEFFL